MGRSQRSKFDIDVFSTQNVAVHAAPSLYDHCADKASAQAQQHNAKCEFHFNAAGFLTQVPSTCLALVFIYISSAQFRSFIHSNLPWNDFNCNLFQIKLLIKNFQIKLSFVLAKVQITNVDLYVATLGHQTSVFSYFRPWPPHILLLLVCYGVEYNERIGLEWEYTRKRSNCEIIP